MNPVIDIQNISKKYRINTNASYLSLRDALSHTFRNMWGPAKAQEHFYALKDIDLRIGQGERVGIIGRNGAGKSTLLKIISRITPPTKGRVIMEGRVASLLEVGTGFHPELTGRENIYFNGSILGLKKKEIDRKLDAIIDFSGIEKFMETPLKHYSSGMQLRLAFSVAAHLEPEILLIDEVLAVGDMEFQKKCMGKMEEVSKSEGRTILFVSHNMNYIASLCNSAVLLDQGKVKKMGSVAEVIHGYLSHIGTSASQYVWEEQQRPGNDVVRLISVKVIDASGAVQDSFAVHEAIGIEMNYEVFENGHVLWLGHNIYNDKGINVFDSHSVSSDLYQKPHEKGMYKAVAWIPGNLLNTGSFIVSTAIFNHISQVIYLHEKEILLFHVHDVFDGDTARGMSPGDFPGVVRPLLNWTINKL
jgi:lipopolysaccharide transport system ATP-binding protein